MNFDDIDLAGTWSVGKTGQTESVAARVPGVVQYDLIRAGALSNPFASTAAATAAHWVSDSSWTYQRTIELDPTRAAVPHVLEFDGIDTFGTVTLNGIELGSTGNALRSHRFPVPTSALVPGENLLQVRVDSHQSGVEPLIEEARRRLRHKGPIEGLLGKSLLRRYQRSFFSMSSLLNLGTGVLGIGVHGAVRFVAAPTIEVSGIFVETTAIVDEVATLRITVDLRSSADGSVEIELDGPDGTRAAFVTIPVSAGEVNAITEVSIIKPRLWWPKGYGAPDLYTATATARDVAGNERILRRQVGIRTSEVIRTTPSGRPTFQFVVNGVPVWVRGTNYIPVDYLKVHGTDAEYERVFALLESGNNNLVRMWGGGATESDGFYEECNRRGIMIWQDFYLHSNTYPDYDSDWVDEFRREAEDLVLRIRQHPCLVLLCGGNEQREGYEEWHWRDTLEAFFGESLVMEVIPEVIARLGSGVPYINNSPHGGLFSQSPVEGEAHVWGNHFNSTKDPLFVTETCWGQDSYSRPETLQEVMDLDVDEFVGPDWIDRWTALTSLPLVMRFPYTGYHNVGGLRSYLKGLEVEQAMADYHSMGNFRLRSPSCRGFVYWSFNKGGPLFQFGAVDYRLRPMMSHFVMARLNRDVVVGAYRDVSDIRVVASNGTSAPVSATVEVVHLDGAGNRLGEWSEDVTIEPGAPQRLLTLIDHYEKVVDRTSESVFVELRVGELVLSRDHLLFCPMAEFLPQDQPIQVDVVKSEDGAYVLELVGSGVSKMIEIEGADALIASDNYFPLVPGYPATVRLARLSTEDAPSSISVGTLDGRHQSVPLPQ